MKGCEVKKRVKVEIPQSKNHQKRQAIFELKYEKVKIRRPERFTEANAYLEGKKLPKFMEVTVVEMQEVSLVVEGEKPIKRRWK